MRTSPDLPIARGKPCRTAGEGREGHRGAVNAHTRHSSADQMYSSPVHPLVLAHRGRAPGSHSARGSATARSHVSREAVAPHQIRSFQVHGSQEAILRAMKLLSWQVSVTNQHTSVLSGAGREAVGALPWSSAPVALRGHFLSSFAAGCAV